MRHESVRRRASESFELILEEEEEGYNQNLKRKRDKGKIKGLNCRGDARASPQLIQTILSSPLPSRE